MKILGIDFTSTPTKRKPITCVTAELTERSLEVSSLSGWTDLSQFEEGLAQSGPWVAGIDLPFGQSRKFVNNKGWPRSWKGYVQHVSTMTRKEFRTELDDYRQNRMVGDKEHRRACDIQVGAISPQKLYGVPVALMFFEGAPRIQRSGATIPGLQDGDPNRVVIEAYPGLLARTLIGRHSYKSDTRSKQTAGQLARRQQILRYLTSDQVNSAQHQVRVTAPQELAEDPSGDALDALLCAVQASWSWQMRHANYGLPSDYDDLEGWIIDPRTQDSCV